MKKLLLFIFLCASSVLVGQNYYEILGIPRTATADEIERAFRGKRREHPNLVEQRLRRQQPPLDEKRIQEQIRQAAERFQDYSAAHDVLKEPSKKKIYDANLQRGHDQASAAVGRHERAEGDRRAREADIEAREAERRREAEERRRREVEERRRREGAGAGAQAPKERVTPDDLRPYSILLRGIIEQHKSDRLRQTGMAGAMYQAELKMVYIKFYEMFEKFISTKRAEANDFDLRRIARGLIDVVNNETLRPEAQNRLDAIKAEVQRRLKAAPPLARPEDRLKALMALEEEVWLWTYLDRELRETIIRQAIALVEAFQEQGKQEAAAELVDKMLKTIDQEWGRNFPINPALRQQLEQLKAPGPTPRPTPAPTPKQISPQELAQVERMIGARDYRGAINRLKGYQPATNAKIVNTYIQFINDVPLAQKLKIVAEAEQFARKTDADLKQKGISLPKFDEAYRTLQDLAAQVRRAQPTPTPAPSVSIPQLGRDLQALQKQLDALNRQLRGVR